jgi:hypothetical protein
MAKKLTKKQRAKIKAAGFSNVKDFKNQAKKAGVNTKKLANNPMKVLNNNKKVAVLKNMKTVSNARGNTYNTEPRIPTLPQISAPKRTSTPVQAQPQQNTDALVELANMNNQLGTLSNELGAEGKQYADTLSSQLSNIFGSGTGSLDQVNQLV